MTSDADQRFRLPEQVHTRRFDDELVVLDLVRGEYFALDEVGAIVWEHLVAGKTLAEVAVELVATYDVVQDTALSDVRRLVGELVAMGLIERRE